MGGGEGRRKDKRGGGGEKIISVREGEIQVHLRRNGNIIMGEAKRRNNI